MKNANEVKVVPVIQCNCVDFEGATDVSLRTSPDGRFVIEKVIENAKALSRGAPPIIACPDREGNAVFKRIASEHGIQCYMGDDVNVAARLMGAATAAGGTHIAWLQGLLYFLDIELMDSLVRFSQAGKYDYVRCVDGTCKHWLGQFVSVDALKRLLSFVKTLDPSEQAHFSARPFAFMRANPELFRVGLFEELPTYSTEKYLEMREIARRIHTGGERAQHTEKASTVGDVSIGRYKEILGLIVPGSEVLDIACGTGYGSNLIARSGSRVIGVDINEDVVREAQNKFGHIAEFRVGDGRKIPLPDGAVDTVVSIGSVEHIADDHAFVRELHRVIREGGKAIIYTPQNRLGAIPTWPWHEKEYSIDQLKDLFSTASFQVKQVWGWQNGVITKDDPRGDGTYLIAERV